MPVQKKSNRAAPGEKKKLNWVQIGAVAFVILVVAMCIVVFSNFDSFFSGNNSNISSSKVEDGDPVAIYYATIINNNTTFAYYPTDEQKVDPIRIVANRSVEHDDDSSIIVQMNNNLTLPYGIPSHELNEIAEHLTEFSYGDTIVIPISYMLYTSSTPEELTSLGYNMDNVTVGSIITVPVTYTNILGQEGKYLRNGVVTNIFDDENGQTYVTVNCGADEIMVQIYGKYTE